MTTEQMKTERRKFVVPETLADHWLSLSEACDKLSISRWTVAELCTKGVLDREEYGKFILISRKSVDAYLKAFIPSSR